MDIHDFGTLIWAIFIVIAVISSLLRSANRAMRSGQQQQQRRPQPQAQPQPQSQAPRSVVPSTLTADAVRTLGMTRVPRPVPSECSSTFSRGISDRGASMDAGATRPRSASEAGERASSGSEVKVLGLERALREASGHKSSIGSGKGALVRGIVALEVLGPPRALREWNSIV